MINPDAVIGEYDALKSYDSENYNVKEKIIIQTEINCKTK